MHFSNLLTKTETKKKQESKIDFVKIYPKLF